MVMGRNGMGRNGYGPKWSWAEMVMGRNDPEPVKALRKISMLKKVAKLLEIVGRSYIEDNMLD